MLPSNIVVIDVETSGLDPLINEILSICALPIDQDFKYNPHRIPFVMTFKPDNPELVDVKALKVNKLKMEDLMNHGTDHKQGAKFFIEWLESLDVPLVRGERSRICPLGQNYFFDKMFIEPWLGEYDYTRLIDHRHRDTLQTAMFIHDQYYYQHNRKLFYNFKLVTLCKRYGVPYENAHNATADCIATARVYRKMLQARSPII
jgi:DNA polymerase III epsilon subunit-like protein